MSLSNVITGKTPKPARIIVYGPEGIGKSSFGASAYNPIFIQTEEGLNEIGAPRFPLAKTFGEVMESLKTLYNEKHEYKTVVIDTLDWLEPLVWAETCVIHGEPHIIGKEKKSSFAFGRGYSYALDQWKRLTNALDLLREERGIACILLAHAEVKRYDSPETDPYDRFQIRLQSLAASKLCDWADAVLFAKYNVQTESAEVGFSKKVVRGTGGTTRVICTEERPAYRAKNKYGLPPVLPFDKGQAWSVLIEAIKNSRED